MAEYARNGPLNSREPSDEAQNHHGPGLIPVNNFHYPSISPANRSHVGGLGIAGSARSVTVDGLKMERTPAVIGAKREESVTPAKVKQEPLAPPAPAAVPAAPIAPAQLAQVPPVPAPQVPAFQAPGLPDPPALDPSALDPAALDPSALAAPASPGSPIPASQPSQDAEDEIEVVGVLETIDARGDLIIIAGASRSKRQFRVCSNTLFRKSPFLERRFRLDPDAPHRQEHRDRSPSVALRVQELRKVHLPEVEPDAFYFILLVIHCDHRRYQQKMFDPKVNSQQLLSDVIAVAHNCEMMESLQPVADKWLRKVYNRDVKRHDELGNQLWITAIVGHLTCVKHTAFRMVTTGRLNSKGELLGFGAEDEEPYSSLTRLEALNMLGMITDCRKAVVDKLVGFIDNMVENLTCSPKKTTIRPQGGYLCIAKDVGELEQDCCDNDMLGAFLRTLEDHEWQRVDPRGSPDRLHKKISSIVYKTVDRCRARPRPDDWDAEADPHLECGPVGYLPGLKELVAEEIERIPWPREEFARRSVTAGILKTDGEL